MCTLLCLSYLGGYLLGEKQDYSSNLEFYSRYLTDNKMDRFPDIVIESQNGKIHTKKYPLVWRFLSGEEMCFDGASSYNAQKDEIPITELLQNSIITVKLRKRYDIVSIYKIDFDFYYPNNKKVVRTQEKALTSENFVKETRSEGEYAFIAKNIEGVQYYKVKALNFTKGIVEFYFGISMERQGDGRLCQK